MKDFLYLDTDSISSISAQLFEGKILEIVDEKEEFSGKSITDNYGSNEKEGTSTKIGTNGTNISGIDENGTFESKAIQFLNNDTFKLGVKKAYDDYLYNKVLEQLQIDNQIHPMCNSNQFDFVEIQGDYTVLDISTSSKIFDTELLRQIPFIENFSELPTINFLNDKFKSARRYLNSPGSKKFPKQFFKDINELNAFHDDFQNLSMIKVFNEITKHLSTVLGDKIILNNGNTILIGDEKWLRIPGETISLANELTVEGFGRKITLTKPLESVVNFQNVAIEESEFLSKGTQSMLMLFLTSILNLNQKDTFEIIQPIGLEYSKVPR
ncbi:hypothetical protein ACUW90_001903 [Staphylococcus simulans]|uniref:DUF6414 family protein n=1 Tax=Staphylococcus simulans TaxID=1286 RepID=UPI0030C14FF0